MSGRPDLVILIVVLAMSRAYHPAYLILEGSYLSNNCLYYFVVDLYIDCHNVDFLCIRSHLVLD